jgi:hypothetical protein
MNRKQYEAVKREAKREKEIERYQQRETRRATIIAPTPRYRDGEPEPDAEEWANTVRGRYDVEVEW